MSKNFEEEYKALASEDLPDLWSRIESGLTPKYAALPKDAKDSRRVEGKGIKEEPGSKVITFFYKYRTVAAAAVCAIVIIPAVIMLGRVGRSKTWEAADEAAQGVDSSAQEESGETAAAVAEDIWDDAEDETAAVTKELPEPGMAGGVADGALSRNMDSGGASQEGSDRFSGNGKELADMDSISEAAVEMADADSASGAIADMAEMVDGAEEASESKKYAQIENASQESAKVESLEAEKVKVYEGVTVKATQNTGETVQTERNMFHGVKMKVIKDPSGELAKGTEITVWIALSSSQAYIQGEEYTLNLSYDPGRECPYRIAW